MNITRTKKIIAATAVGLVAVSGAGVAAWADGSSGSTPPAAGATATAPSSAHPRARALLGRIDHGVVEIKDAGKWITVDFDRGKVTDVAADHVTLARPDGESVTLKLVPTTKYHGVSSEAEIKTGKGAVVVSNPDGTARQVAQGAGKRQAAAQPAA